MKKELLKKLIVLIKYKETEKFLLEVRGCWTCFRGEATDLLEKNDYKGWWMNAR